MGWTTVKRSTDRKRSVLSDASAVEGTPHLKQVHCTCGVGCHYLKYSCGEVDHRCTPLLELFHGMYSSA